MSSGGTSEAGYRDDIDGLRAVAVLAVIGYHAGLPGFGGGYVGVDIFFVISGFLITRLILRDLHAGRFSLAYFYERRFRRLAPALALVLLACLIPAWLWMLPQQLLGFATSTLAVVAMVPNIHFWKSISYFNPGFDNFPLLHTWSLGIEEQFYIGFSLMLLLLWKIAPRRIGLWLLVAGIASLVACELFRRSSAVAAFYLLPFRAWELLLGGLAAQWVAAPPAASPKWAAARNVMPWLGIGTLLATVLAFDHQTPFPGVWTLLPVAGTLVLLLSTDAGHPVLRMLTCRPVVAIGLISYSAYLWHYPVFIFAALAWLEPPEPWQALGLIALVLALAGLSWRFVEQPARRQQRPFRQVLTGVLLVIGIICGFVWWVWSGNGLPNRLPAAANALLEIGASRNPRQAECLGMAENGLRPEQACLLGDAGKSPTVVLIGDSHADALFEALDQQLRRSGLAARFMAYGGCPPVPAVRRLDMRNNALCNDYFAAAYELLAARPEIETVILAARWTTYLEGEPFDNGEGGRETGNALVVDVAPGSALAAAGSTRTERVAKAYRHGIERLLAMGKRVVLIHPVPEVGWHVPNWLALHQMRGRPIEGDLSTAAAVFERRNRRTEQAFAGLPTATARLIEIRPSALLCNTVVDGRCMAQIDGMPLYYDDNHLNLAGADKVVAAIADALGWRDAAGGAARQ